MIFDLLDMMATYVQYLSLLVSIAPDSLPLFYGDTLNVIRYFVLDLVSSFSESNRYINPLRVVLPDWLPLDIRLQFVIVIVIAPLALATLGFLVVFSKPGYLLFVVTLSTLFCFAFGALLVANKDLYADHPQPSRTTRVALLAVGLPLFSLLAVFCALLIRHVGTNRRRKEQRAHEHYVLQELRQQEAKALTYDLVDREHLDVDLLAAERSRRAHKKARIGSLNVCDVCLQSLMVVCLCVGGLICIGGIPVAGMKPLQGSQFMAAVGGILLAVAGLCLIWLVLSLFRKGRAIRLAVGGYLGALFLSLIMICCSSLYTIIVTTFVSIMYCDTLTCETGSRPPHTGALFPAKEARSPSMGRIGSVSVGCSACNLDAYPQQCSATWKDSLCSQAVEQPRLTYDARVLCSQVDGFFRASASIMLCAYLLFVPILQLVLACYSVDLLQRRFPLEYRVVQLFTEMELFYEKVLTSKGHASFMYNAYKPSFRYYRLTFLLQKAMMALICCTTKRGANASYAWVGLMLFTIIPTIAVVCAVVLQPFTRPTETFFFPTLQSLVALFSMVVLIAERTGRRLSYGVGVLLFVLAVAVPLATLIIGTVLTLHMEQRRYNLLLLRLQLVMTKAASGNKGNASLSHSLRGSNSSRTRGMSTAGTCDASTLKHNWLERQVLRFVQWLDPEIEAGDDIALVDGAGVEERGDDFNAYQGASRRRSDRATVVHRVRQGSGEAGAEALDEEGAIVAVGRQPTSSKTAHRFRRFTHEDQLDALDEEDEEVVGHDVNARRRQTGESTVAANSIVTNNNNNSWVTNTVPRRKRARAVLLVGGAAEQAEAFARRHERARQREVSGQGDFILPTSEEEQVASHWRRWCGLCGLCGSDGEDTADGNEDGAEGRGSSSKKRDGQLFAMTGERAVLRKQALSKLERRVAEYDTGAYVFLPEAYFLRRYYPDGTDEDGGGGEHGRFWTLFSNLLWPTIRRFSDESTRSGEANGAVCEERRQTRVVESAEASSPLNRRASAMRDAPEAAERPKSRSRIDSVLVADPNLSPSAEQEADQHSTIRSRRAHARAQRCDITDWVSASDSAFVAPSAQLEEAAISASRSVLDSYVYVVPSPRAVNPGAACADGTARPPTGTVPSAMRRRGQHCFQLSDSPSDAAVFSHHIGRAPSRAAVGGARYGSSGYAGVATVDPDSVFAGRQATDAFLFNRHALAPRNSDVEAGGATTAAGAPSPSGHFCATPTRVPIKPRASAAARRRGEPSVAASAPPLEPPSPSVAFLPVNRAFDGGEVRDNRPSLSISFDSRDSETARAQRPWATDAHSGESRSRDADDVDDDDTFDDAEDDARRKSMPVTCFLALKVFFLHFWHQLQEWLGIRYTQDAVLHRLQQRDGLGSHAHTLLTYPVVFKRRQAGEEVRRALASQTDARTRASTGSQRAGCDDGNTDSLLPYARPYWRMPSAAMLGAADVRGSAMPWYLRTIHAEPSLVQAGVDVHTRTERDAVPSMSLSVYGLIDRYRRMRAEDEAHAHVAAPSQPPLTSIYESTETFIIRVPDGNAADGDSEGDDAANESLVLGAPPDTPTTRTARARFVQEPAYGSAAQATHPPAPPPPAAVVSEDAFSWLGGSAATVLSDEDSDDARGSDSNDNHTRPAPATYIGGDQEAHSRRTLPHVRRPLPPASSAMVVAQNSGQAASWAEHCLFVAQETLVGFGHFWRQAERRSPVTRNGRLEEYAESVPTPPPSNQLKDAHFVELLREVLLPDVSSDDEDERDDTSGSGTVDTNSEASGEASSSSQAGSPRQGDDNNTSSNESFIFGAFPTDSPVVTPVCGGAQWTGVDAATSRRLSAARVNGPAPYLPSTGATHASTPTTQDTQDDLKMEKNDGATMAAFESSPREEQCMKASQHPRATGAGGVSQRQQVTVWQAWLTPDLKPDQAFREANGGLGNADKSIAGVQKTAATTPPGAAREGEVTEGTQWDEATAACLRLLRCQYLLRERLADVFWAQRRRLHRVQTAVDGKIDRVVHVFLGFLFVWLGLLACLCLALVFCGMLNTVDSVLVTGTHRERSDVEYQLAGYHSWEAFTLHCCCTAAENINASFPFYALDVENWLCDNGKVKERVRRDSFEDVERSGYRVRGLCGMSFLNGCVLHTSSDGSSVRVENCTVPDLADYELERW